MSGNGKSDHPPVTPVCPVAPVSPVKPLAPASVGALRADDPSVVVIAHFQGMILDATSCDGGSVHPPVTPV